MKTKKIITLMLAVLVALPTAFTLSGCDGNAIDPAKFDIWGITELYVDDDSQPLGYRILQAYYDHDNYLINGKDYNDYWNDRIFYDSATFAFKKDGKFEMKTLRGEMRYGTYTTERVKPENNAAHTSISITFDDGTEAYGSVVYYAWGGNSGAIKVDDITYFIKPGASDWGRDAQSTDVETEKTTLKSFLESGLKRWQVIHNGIDGPFIDNERFFCKGIIIKENEDYYFLDAYDGAKLKLTHFSEAYSFYNLNSDGEFTAIPMSIEKQVIVKRWMGYAPVYPAGTIIYLIS